MTRFGPFLKTILLMATLSIPIAGCGFQPLHAQRQDEITPKLLLASVFVAPIPERLGQLTRNALEQRLEKAGQTVDKLYTLHVSVSETVIDRGIRKDATATRGEIRMTGTFSLERDGGSLWSGTSQATVSYNILDNHYASMVSQEDALSRGIETMADDIVQRLTLFLLNQQKLTSG